MLAAQASDEGWTLSDGKLTVTGEVYSEYFSYWNDVQSIEVTGGFFALSDGMSFSGIITVLESGTFTITEMFLAPSASSQAVTL